MSLGNRALLGRTGAGTTVLLALGACLGAPAPPAPPPPVPSPPPAAIAWTATDSVPLIVGDGVGGIVARAFTRVEILYADSTGLLIRCSACDPVLEGVVPDSAVVREPLPPEVAAWGTLAEFALAVREAARQRDLAALRPVMAAQFSYSFVGVQTPEAAFDVWRSEEFATLDRLPELLDRGLGPLDPRIRAAPPEFLDEIGYRGLRAGFRRSPEGQWEWVFLIGGIVR